MLIKFFRVTVLIILITITISKSYSNIIYEKKNIIITEIELEKFKQLNFKSTGEILSDEAMIKKIFLIKKTVNKILIRNPDAMQKIDNNIKQEIGEDNFSDKVNRDYFRFFKIRNEFIFEYFRNKFTLSDLKNIFFSFDKIMIPLSTNKCLTIDNLVDLKNNDAFLNNYYFNIKNNKNEYSIVINNREYNACVNDKINGAIESKIIKYIENLTEDEFKKFIYND